MSLQVVFHVVARVELIGSGQVAGLHLEEDALGIDEMAAREVEVYAGTEKLLGQQRNVEAIGIVSGKVTTGEAVCQLLGQLLESGCVFDIVVGDAGELLYFVGDGLPGLTKMFFRSSSPLGDTFT